MILDWAALEVIPLINHLTAGAVAVSGLSLVAHDGVVALIGSAVVVVAVGLGLGVLL